MKIVLFSGRGETGKDHHCRLVQSAFGFRQLGFSDVGKWYGVGMGWWTWEEAYITKPPHVRTRMQMKLTEEHRDKVDQAVWVNAFFAMAHTLNERFGDFDKIVMMDGRFINEVTAVQDAGGLVIRLESDKANATKFTDEQKAHRSEAELDGFNFQHVVDNSEARWATAECEVYSLVWEYLHDES
jgi:hypothetical protein